MEPSSEIVVDEDTAKLLDEIAGAKVVDASELFQRMGGSIVAFGEFLSAFGFEKSVEAKVIMQAVESNRAIAMPAALEISSPEIDEAGNEDFAESLASDLSEADTDFEVRRTDEGTQVVAASILSAMLPAVVPIVANVLKRWVAHREETTVIVSHGGRKITIRNDVSVDEISRQITKMYDE